MLSQNEVLWLLVYVYAAIFRLVWFEKALWFI